MAKNKVKHIHNKETFPCVFYATFCGNLLITYKRDKITKAGGSASLSYTIMKKDTRIITPKIIRSKTYSQLGSIPYIYRSILYIWRIVTEAGGIASFISNTIPIPVVKHTHADK